MPVQRQCNSCKKMATPFINPKTENVFCDLCRSSMPADHFLKVQLKTLKQFEEKNSKPFAVKCQSCEKEDTPILHLNKFYCPACRKEHKNLSEPFKMALKISLPKVGRDIDLDKDDE